MAAVCYFDVGLAMLGGFYFCSSMMSDGEIWM